MNDFREYKNYLMHYGVKGMKWHDHVYQQDQPTRPNPQAKSERTVYDRTKVEKHIQGYMKDLKDQGRLDTPEQILSEIVTRREVMNRLSVNDPSEAAERQANIDAIKQLESYLKKNFGKEAMKKGNYNLNTKH